MLKGLTFLDSIKSIWIESNIFLTDSCEQLKPILKRQVPSNLEELRLIGMRTVPLITGKIMESLAFGCHLRRLAIVNGELSDINMRQMCKVIKHARFLIELDISANKMTPLRMLELSNVLADNR